MNPSVYVIILNWNHLDDLIVTVESFRKQDYPNLTLVISDNGSTDGSIDYIKSNNSDLILLENRKNLGWAAGNNVGIKYALKNNTDYILLSNNDIWIEDIKLISILVKNIQEFACKRIKIIGAKENYFTPKNKLRTDGWIMYPDDENNRIYFNRFRNEYPYSFPINFKLADFVSGSFMLIKSDLFREIGLIDEAFFMYFDEAEFSYRAWQAGYASLINQNLTVYHKGAATASPFVLYYQNRNRYYFLKKHRKTINKSFYFRKRLIIGYLYNLFRNFFQIIIFPSRYNNKGKDLFFAKLIGLLDGLFNRMGKRIKLIIL